MLDCFFSLCYNTSNRIIDNLSLLCIFSQDEDPKNILGLQGSCIKLSRSLESAAQPSAAGLGQECPGIPGVHMRIKATVNTSKCPETQQIPMLLKGQ